MRLAWSFALLVAFAAAPDAYADEAPPPDALATYEQQALGVRNLHLAGRDLAADGGRQAWMYPDAPWDAFRGPDHHPISEEAFFRIVGRDDLLTRYRHEALFRHVLTASGGAALAGGLIFAWIEYLYRTEPPQISYPGSPPPQPGISAKWGFAIAGAGLLTMIVSHHLDPTPIDAGEADRLARDYDQSLRSRLGLTETAARP
jgi:hypothetical protein